MLRKKSVWSVVLLSLFTLGIYMLWWFYDTTRALQWEGGYEDLSPSWLFVVLLILFPVGGAIFALSAYENLIRVRYLRSLPPRDQSKTLWILMGAISPIVTVGVVQYEINRLFDTPQYGSGQYGSNFYNSSF